ncbi:hypothetical protein RJT34_16757 [Clitoria ternatea]|uniref:Uncharacterized protein n=1 Tax=Clitoria ternatea TaxID=43366 RepID=A0AAN9J7N8_CLITE
MLLTDPSTLDSWICDMEPKEKLDDCEKPLVTADNEHRELALHKVSILNPSLAISWEGANPFKQVVDGQSVDPPELDNDKAG